tara:strand:+ start:142 stop:381 length:240 start_codon:yes stop_codon:yes gene_type:complete
MIYIILSLLTSPVLPVQPTVSITAVKSKSSGYSAGYGVAKSAALADALRNVPKGAHRGETKFIQVGIRHWKCIIRWVVY